MYLQISLRVQHAILFEVSLYDITSPEFKLKQPKNSGSKWQENEKKILTEPKLKKRKRFQDSWKLKRFRIWFDSVKLTENKFSQFGAKPDNSLAVMLVYYSIIKRKEKKTCTHFFLFLFSVFGGDWAVAALTRLV